jgi:hypothetical protein
MMQIKIYKLIFSTLLLAGFSIADAMQKKPSYVSIALKGHVETIKQQEIEKQKKAMQDLLQRLDHLQINDCYGSESVRQARIYIAQNRQEDITFKAFCMAEYDEYHELFKILLDAGADPNYKREDDPSDSTFTRACIASSVAVSKNAKLLVERGATPKIIGKIIWHTKPPVVDWLVQLGNKEEEIYKWGPQLCGGLP